MITELAFPFCLELRLTDVVVKCLADNLNPSYNGDFFLSVVVNEIEQQKLGSLKQLSATSWRLNECIELSWYNLWSKFVLLLQDSEKSIIKSGNVKVNNVTLMDQALDNNDKSRLHLLFCRTCKSAFVENAKQKVVYAEHLHFFEML
ncbi:hypothetical protein AcW1_002274 [Taiwanofungus camphoratus]|nr:hypothetical protein AcW1_002274 [Antrodia cinnamomea]